MTKKQTRTVRVLDILIIIATIIGFGIMAVIGITVVRVAPTISLGQATSTFSGASGNINVPIALSNPGPLALNNVAIGVLILDREGTILFQGGGVPISLSPGTGSNLQINIPINFATLSSQTLQELATTNENFSIRTDIIGSIHPWISLDGNISTVMPWGALVENLSFGIPEVQSYNSTSAQFHVPFEFTNNSPYIGLSGVLSGTILDGSGNQVGTISDLAMNVSQKTLYNGELAGFISFQSMQDKSFTLKLSFQTVLGTFSESEVISNA